MKLERKIFIFTMINNLIISIIKVIGGILFSLNSLFADGIQTLSDFVTDVVCLIGSFISNKKPTKVHPFGFGRVEYLTNLFVGIFLFLVGIFIIVTSFSKEAVVPSINVLWLLLIVFILKLISILLMKYYGTKIHSHLLLTSVEESKTDLYSTAVVFLITILLQFEKSIHIFKYSDIIGTIFIGFVIIKTAFIIVRDNSLALIGEVDDNDEVNHKIKEVLSKYKEIEKEKIELIKYSSYYKLQLDLGFDSSLTIYEITKLIKKIKLSLLRHKDLNVKYVSIYLIRK